MMLNPNATYDVLRIGEKLQMKNGDFSVSEIFLFGYLSCLMSIYDGMPTSFWGYLFVKNELGMPLSSDILKVVDYLEKMNEINHIDAYYRITDNGYRRLSDFGTLHNFNRRNIFIDAACDCLVAVPLGILREMLKNDPISLSANTNDIKLLNDDSNYAMGILHEQFEILNEVLNKKYDDLFIPAISWLKYLQVSSIEHNHD